MADDGVDLVDLAAAVRSAEVPERGTRVTDVTHDSRVAGPGTLFVALQGSRVDGHAFIESAIAAGSPAVCVSDAAHGAGVPRLIVDDTRTALAVLADIVHGHPSRRMRVVGVTGTNGKTTVTQLLGSIGRAAGIPTAVAGTVGARILDDALPMERTTPEASDFQRLLARMVSVGVDLAAVEVSSHGLAMHRIDRTEFAVGAFTNLSRDHLDLHGDMESYYSVKRSLFDRVRHAVVWVDDPWGDRLASGLTVACTTVGYAGADVTGDVTATSMRGSVVEARDAGGSATMTVPLPGRFNVANALIAAAIARVLGLEWDTIAAGVSSVPVVPGRFELVETEKDFHVVVDYAHTPDGIRAAVGAAREILAGSGRVIAVVGAGGDRDRGKRPEMGAAAASADIAVLTSDNPRFEDPLDILDDVVAGVPAEAQRIVEADRRAAIRRAVSEAREGDVILILGKGHETGQEIDGRMLPFDDRMVAAEEARSS